MKKISGRKDKRRSGRFYIVLMVGFLSVVMAMQLVSLHHKSEQYMAREKALEEELRDQKERQQELIDYEQYTKSEEYTRNTAKSKLGLVSPNEIIFRER